MAISMLPLSYCANVHPGDSFDEAWANLNRHARPTREKVGQPIAAGLWMTRSAVADVVRMPERLDGLRQWLTEHGLACYTMNAFPFGDFHAKRVKDNVYLPDWAADDRLHYTCQVADVLTRLLPPDGEGSISTVPLAFKRHRIDTDYSPYFPRLIAVCERLAGIQARDGRTIRLAIEPEPLCVLETTAETIKFFRQLRDHLVGRPQQRAVAEHLGVCYDVCHQAVEFEDIAGSIDQLTAEGIRINKVHLTCALELSDPTDADARQELAGFVEERYLHQTFAVHPSGKRLILEDLTADHATAPPTEWLECPKWRIHFHVPVNETHLGRLGTTRPALVEVLQRVAKLDYAPHLEVETYTWGVLPSGQKPELSDGLAAELTATLQAIASVSA